MSVLVRMTATMIVSLLCLSYGSTDSNSHTMMGVCKSKLAKYGLSRTRQLCPPPPPRPLSRLCHKLWTHPRLILIFLACVDRQAWPASLSFFYKPEETDALLTSYSGACTSIPKNVRWYIYDRHPPRICDSTRASANVRVSSDGQAVVSSQVTGLQRSTCSCCSRLARFSSSRTAR